MKTTGIVRRIDDLGRAVIPRRYDAPCASARQRVLGVHSMGNDAMQLFEDQPIRSAWDAEREEWYFSVVDVVQALTGQPDFNTARKYWNKLKQRLSEEGAGELVTNCHQLKLKSPKDGKRYKTDVADTEQLLRIIQSIPSPKAEPFKLWLAQVGRERIEETIDPEQAIDRALETYLKKGYSEEWVRQRLLAIASATS